MAVTMEARDSIAERIEASLAMYGDVMTPEEVARVLHVTPKCVRDMCAKAQLHGVKVGRLWRIPKPTFVDYLLGVLA